MTGFDYILHRANGTLVELNSQVGTFRAVTSERLTAVRQDVSSAELTLVSSEAITVNVGDWIQAKGMRLYCMSTIDKYTCSEDNNREYQLTFYSPEYYLRLAIFYNTSESESGGAYSYSRVDNTYPSVGTFEDFVKLCCYNCNSVQGERMFKVGTVSESIATDIRVMTYSDYNCLAVLKQSCEEFETTWRVRVNEDVDPDSVFIIDFGAAIDDFPVTLKVEHAQGLTSIDVTASDRDVYTQFVIKGGSENLPSDYPYPNLQLDEDPSGTPQVLANSMIKLPDLYSRWGKSIKELTYEDIKPSRTGTVTSTSENILKFTDSDLIGAAWSPVGGTIHFVSGHLIGFTFNCQDFNSATGEITIESTEESNGFILPSPTDSYYRINELDKYNIAGVSLPTSYITAAKAALKERALLGIDYWSQPRMQYAITIDPKIISVEIVPNMGFHIEHPALGIDKVINVQQVIYDLSKESPYDIESILISDLKTDDSRADATHRQIATTAHRLDETDKTSSSIKTVIKNLDTYIDGAFYDGVISKAEADAIEKYINIVNSQKSDIDAQFTALYANSYLSGDPKTNLNSAKEALNTSVSNLLDSIATAITDGAASEAEKADVDSKFTAFNSALSTYQTRVEEAKGAIEAAIEVAANDYTNEQLSDYAEVITGSLGDLQNQIDGNITTWFYAYVPTTANAPASDWTTMALKNQHLGDLFYDTETGYCYRFQLSGETYSWVKITDTDVTKALADAAAAQDTADNKRRVFVATPTTPYEVGDLWTGGPEGDLKKCKVERLTGAYNAADWELASKYTDDTAVEQLESDLEYLKRGFQDGSTYVTGGLVLSEFVGVTDGATPTPNVVAGMAGKDFVQEGEEIVDSPMIFAGATSAQNANSAKARIYKDGRIYGEDVYVKGSIRNPFDLLNGYWETELDDKSDNVYYNAGGGFGIDYDMLWDDSQSGRRRTVLIRGGSHTLYAPEGKYFFENGITKTSLTLSNELVDLIGFADSTGFLGWIVLSRVNFNTTYKYGKELRAMAMGRIYASSGSVADTSIYRTFDKSALTITLISTGLWEITMPSGWFASANSYLVSITLESDVSGELIWTNIHTRTATSFRVATNERSVGGGTAVTRGFSFVIYNMEDWPATT